MPESKKVPSAEIQMVLFLVSSGIILQENKTSSVTIIIDRDGKDMVSMRFDGFTFSSNEAFGLDLKKLQDIALQSFLCSDTDKESLQKANARTEELKFLLAPGDIDKNYPVPDGAPTTKEITDHLPKKEEIHQLYTTTGIFSVLKYNTEDEIQAQLTLLSKIKKENNSEIRSQLGQELENVKNNNTKVAKERYFDFFLDRPKTVLSALSKCGPLVIAAHRKIVDSAMNILNEDAATSSGKEVAHLWRLPYIDIRKLIDKLHSRSSDEKIQTSEKSERKMIALQAIDIFRSPHYSLLPYFNSELQFLKIVSPRDYEQAVTILEQLVDERYGVASLGSKGIRTRKPIKCIKLMAYLVRRVFTYLYPCENFHLYNRCNIPTVESKKNFAPIISLHTANGQPLTRAHGEVHDAVCTLWAAGNEIVTDLMIARTIWPHSSRQGSETFSQKELDSINQLMEDLRLADTTIDATYELRKYKKIGPEDHWIVKSYILPCSVVYQMINGGKYMHRAYKILDTPTFFAYASSLGHVLSMPISVLEPWQNEQEKIPRTLRHAQVRTMILGRIHHFLSPSFRKSEKTILMDRIYEAYEISPLANPDIQKKERTAARKAAINILQRLKGEGIIANFSLRKQSGIYRDINIDI